MEYQKKGFMECGFVPDESIFHAHADTTSVVVPRTPLIASKAGPKKPSRTRGAYWLTAIVVLVSLFFGPKQVALIVCHSTRAICTMPQSMLAMDPAPICQVVGYFHGIAKDVHNFASRSPELGLKLETLEVLRNFASQGGGARVISELTSPTHNIPSPSWFTWTYNKVFNNGYDLDHLDIPRPSVVLEDQLHIGECWEFSGDRGQVGIRLAEVIEVSHITVDYIPPALISEDGVRRAPKNISLWGLANDDLIQNRDSRNASTFFVSDYVPAMALSNNNFVLLARVRYDVFNSGVTQRFVVESSPLTTDVVVVLFENNEGSNTTCIYGIGIHGNISRS